MQLNNDLAAQGNFLSQYQSYLAQLVGFFVIEDRVGKAAADLSAGQVSFESSSPSSNSTSHDYKIPTIRW